MDYLFFAAVGYLSGSILFGYLISKYLFHVDIVRQSDDGNPGTANAFQYAGVSAGVLALILELAKGFLPVYAATKKVEMESIGFALVMVAPVLGHAWPFGHGQHGGKAIAVAFGVLLGLTPNITPVLILAFYYIFFSVVVKIYPHIYRSIAAFFCFCMTLLCRYGLCTITTAGIGISCIVILKHLKKYKHERLRVKIL